MAEDDLSLELTLDSIVFIILADPMRTHPEGPWSSEAMAAMMGLSQQKASQIRKKRGKIPIKGLPITWNMVHAALRDGYKPRLTPDQTLRHGQYCFAFAKLGHQGEARNIVSYVWGFYQRNKGARAFAQRLGKNSKLQYVEGKLKAWNKQGRHIEFNNRAYQLVLQRWGEHGNRRTRTAVVV